MITLLALVLTDAPGVTPAAESTRPHLPALRTSTPPVLDGRLDEPVWEAAAASSNFTQHFPDEGAPPTERTEVRVLYDDDSLYVGIDCRQERSPIARQLGRRDAVPPSDGVSLDIDSRGDGTGAFHFEVNAAGVMADALRFNDTEVSPEWDAVWDARVADTGQGYSVELRIPLHVLRFRDAPVQEWGLEVERTILSRQEVDHWAFYPRAAAAVITRFGRLDQLTALRPRRAVQLRPFVVGRASPTLPSSITAGLDAQLPITTDLTLTVAANPDFGQVEADAVVLNLSTYETFLQEKRPFFLERLDLFSSLRTLVYTRRIGAVPPAPVSSPGESLLSPPRPAAILGAVKLAGTLGPRTTVGLLSAVSDRVDVPVAAIDPATGALAVTPRLAAASTAFNVVRIRRSVGARGEIGLLGTTTNRLEPARRPGAACSTVGLWAAADGRCFNDAYVGGIDGRWRSPSGDYAAAGQAVASMLAAGPSRAQPDGIPVEPWRPAGGGSLYVAKEGGAHWLWSSWNHVSGTRLDVNDLGYLDRKNDYYGLANLAYRTLGPWWRTVETRTGVSASLRRTLDGLDLGREVTLTTAWTFGSFWTMSGDAHYRTRRFDDRELGNGSALERARLFGGRISLASDPRRRVVVSASATAERVGAGGAHGDATAQATLRPSPRLELDLSLAATRDTGEPRFAGPFGAAPTAGGPYTFGEQEATSAGAIVHLLYTLTPRLSLQVAGQAFIARVRYGRFFTYEPRGPRERIPLAALTPIEAPAVTADHAAAVLNASAVLRWEYRLGSTLTLVYTRAQATDVAMLKISYWWA